MAYLMIVDDDEDFSGVVAVVLRRAGHEVAIVPDTGSALESMRKRPPDLVVLDVMFPESSCAGFGLARAMRGADDKLRNIRILMLTAINAAFPLGFGSSDVDSGWLPADGFLEKPVAFRVLLDKVSELLGGTVEAGPR